MMMKQFDRIACLPGLGKITFFPWPRPLGSQLLNHSPRPPAPPPQVTKFINKCCLGISLKSGILIFFTAQCCPDLILRGSRWFFDHLNLFKMVI
jgi:hypothetical protein